MNRAEMQCVVARAFGAPREVLSVQACPVPEPGPGEVRLRLILSPIHTHDLELIRGEYGHRPALPMVPGTEAVGLVDAMGPGVTKLSVGQRVSVASTGATWADFFIAPGASVVALPDHVDDAAACQLLAMPLSAGLLVDDLGVARGDGIIQNASNGAIGRAINAFGRRRGFRVINLVRSAAAAEALRHAGATHVVATDDPGWRQGVLDASEGCALTHGIDSLGGDAANEVLSTLSEGGTLVSFGSMASLTVSLHVDHLLYKSATVRGYWAARRAQQVDGAVRARLLGEAVDMVSTGELVLAVDEAHALAGVQQAISAVARQNRTGKVALRGPTQGAV